ncbi:hypothetical protein CY34DRAFT_227797 [Suillus luteus UH-Slu-Lm8-n1]|uniref:WD40 repeat-like protein n=1 Tax=Suillus luteus UH-Slu-Lm8-n1 TaxID=930992 RepID=A0A0D0BCB4_9AGAM|nr:hypothetical protein CY34DRAFT_227797 [Suillus luteus UH-Slu-Lm8-n1]
MASTSTQSVATADIPVLTPVMTLEGHEPWNITSEGETHELKYISCISYFPDGKQMISGSRDETIRRWDLRKGKEMEKDREVDEYVNALGVSRDGRWVVIAGGNGIKVSEVETGIVRTFHEDSWIDCIDISADSTLLAGGSYCEVRIWNLDTGEPVAGPFDIGDYIPHALRFSEDSRKLAVSSYDNERDSNDHHLEVWDVHTQKLDVQKHTARDIGGLNLPIFWTTKDKSIVTAFNSPADKISEFDASTLKTIGAPFKLPSFVHGLALSSDCVLLASSSYDRTIKLWAFESRQLLASFHVESFFTLLFSPDSRQLACTCRVPTNLNILIYSTLMQHVVRDPRPFPRFLRKLLPFSSRTNVVHTEPHNLLDFPATSPLPRSHISQTPAPLTTQPSAINISPTLPSRLLRLWPLQTNHASPTIVDVPLAPGKLRIAAAGALGDDDDLIRDEDYVPPPSPSPNSRPGIANAGQHGSGRFCFCF